MRFFLQFACAAVCAAAVFARAQTAPAPGEAQELARVSHELQQTRAELAESRREIEDLRRGLEDLRQQMQTNQQGARSPSISAGPPAASTPAAGAVRAMSTAEASAQPTVAAADQDTGFLASKIGELHQDKVESASKYPVKISGLVLFNSYWNHGYLDIQDLPNLAFPKSSGLPGPGVGATLRQTVLGVEVTGPKIFGAQAHADAEIDFAGGSPTTSFGETNGLVRLRTAKLSLDWANTTLNLGQDALFFSPLSPASYASLLEPALSWSGNLWVWTPQIEIEHRIAMGNDRTLVFEGGVLDPLTEEDPVFEGRQPTAGEASRAPAIAGRIAYEQGTGAGFPLTLGFGAYRANQQYDSFPTVASWTLNTDFKAGFGSHAQISGEWYTGQAVGGLGGGIWTSVVTPGPDEPYAAIQPLRSTGGWGQLKIMPTTHFEINGAFGQDENFGSDLRVFAVPFSEYGFPALQKNRTELVNVIYKPNSALLFAVEYRHLFTASATGESAAGDHLNLAAGVHF